MHSTLAPIEGLLQYTNEKSDGQIRDPKHPLRAVGGGEGFYVPRSLIRELNLRPGLMVKGLPRGKTVNRIDEVEGKPIDDYARSAGGSSIYEAVALDPSPQIRLEHRPDEFTTRILDILCPIGFGSRGLIVAPPRVGKTILMQNIARGVHANYPEVELVLLLIDERPEEVTDMKRNVPGTVYASSNDNDIAKHLDLAQLVIERCKRRVEMGANIVGGKTLSGGLDSKALEVPKKIFGAARKIENGGSLTILATCLVDTGSKMDQVIFEEFKGTGNMEINLDRKLADQRIFPAINIAESGTRKEEKLLDEKTLAACRGIRRHLVSMPPHQAIRTLTEVMGKVKTNADLLANVRVG
jgi:transcription termination factor Rho